MSIPRALPRPAAALGIPAFFGIDAAVAAGFRGLTAPMPLAAAR
ncbi:hypothetical protein ACU686_43565 [Yinghuangia aomiensis]